MSAPQPSDHLTELVRAHSNITGSPRREPTCTGCNTTLASYEDHTRHIAEMIIQSGWTPPMARTNNAVVEKLTANTTTFTTVDILKASKPQGGYVGPLNRNHAIPNTSCPYLDN